MITRSDGLKISGAERIGFCIGSSESYTVSSDFVRARLLNGNESTWLVDSEIEVAPSGNGYGKSCKSSSLEETHIGFFKEWLDSAVQQESTR